jgi:hypothetical protein
MAMNEDGLGGGGFRAGIEIGPDGKSTGNIICYPSLEPNCKVVTVPQPSNLTSSGFLSLTEPQPFHDEDLQKASAEINKIVLSVLAENKGKNDRDLHVVLAKDGPMLVWTRAMVMKVDDITDLAAD